MLRRGWVGVEEMRVSWIGNRNGNGNGQAEMRGLLRNAIFSWLRGIENASSVCRLEAIRIM
jgi:hypothetical protein